MTSQILHRTAHLEPGTGRTVHGLAVPFGQVVEIDDAYGSYRERFERGAFRRTIADRAHKVKLFTQHDRRRLPIGKATELRETDDGLFAAFEVAATTAGDDALELIRSGVVDNFSIGFRPMRDRRDGDIVTRTEVALLEVSLVSDPRLPGRARGRRALARRPRYPFYRGRSTTSVARPLKEEPHATL
ncbi:HK97 family phage prohead protease [Gordonia paraffinivorans]|uniref:HK97 family phage prohead protease n=1 Tax=Gordonia paraffinivorans TaxID=175628 RepID=UPI003FCC27CA